MFRKDTKGQVLQSYINYIKEYVHCPKCTENLLIFLREVGKSKYRIPN